MSASAQTRTSNSERWLQIPDAPGYEVSDRGHVRSLPRVTVDVIGRSRPFPGVALRPGINPNGYPHVSIRRVDGRRLSRTVHVLVAQAFLGPRPARNMEVRHLNGVPTDCRLINLTYGTRSENQLDKRKHGTDPNVNKTHCPEGHPYDEVHCEIRYGRRYCRTCQKLRVSARRSA